MRGLHQTFFTQYTPRGRGLARRRTQLVYSVASLWAFLLTVKQDTVKRLFCVVCRVNVNTKTFIAVPPHTTVSKDGSAPLGQTQVLTHATTGATGYGLRHPAVLLVKSENKRTRTLSGPLAQGYEGYETLFELHTRTGRLGAARPGGLSTLLLPAYVSLKFWTARGTNRPSPAWHLLETVSRFERPSHSSLGLSPLSLFGSSSRVGDARRFCRNSSRMLLLSLQPRQTVL